ncbi:SGNH/GDSL hydrolase family protein [Streptomyces sp. CNQ085]|uniref:SGNH/GDSL hydrolase family protein n=1 Tax=Streptomyces sp. CNQ085 TaxID=2886944 RepID=UPI001F508ECE|nr:SGNH/GDSL hydrolase family protein [Streptomyces sp. CNQ085]MCI0383290.1 SGNH/GDSL hydrolase family protein [Streptomyces sp. CNQ085]
MRDDTPSGRPPAGRVRRGGLLPAATVALVVFAVSCGGSDGGAPHSRGAPAETRPSPSPSPTWDTGPDSLAALGDSITRAFDACSLLEDCPEASWATGASPEVDSLARRLGVPAAAAWNHARSGALMAELPAQARKAAAHRPELVTVLIGANDACRPTVERMTPVEEFRAGFTEALRTLRRSSPKTQVYVAGVPDLERLWELGRSHPVAARVWQLGICPSMLGGAGAPDTAAAAERRAKVSARVEAYNAALAEVCERAERCRHDGGAVHGHRFTARELSSWDWFHPGPEGQRVLAEIAHRQITAEPPPV